MVDKIEVLISEEEIDARIMELAKEIDKDFAGSEVTLVCVLKGAVFFASELAKRITIPVYMDFIKVSSYKGTESTGTVTLDLDLSEPAAGKNLILVEDVLDTGRTLAKLKEMFEKRGAASLKVCSLLDKHDCRIVPMEGDYIGFTIGDEFVVGYGLDYDQKYRNLPFVGVLKLM